MSSPEARLTRIPNKEPVMDEGRHGPSDVRIGLFHPHAGTRSAGGITVYTQRIAEELSRITPTFLYTNDGDIRSRLEETPLSVVRIPTDSESPFLRLQDLPLSVSNHVMNKLPTYTRLFTDDIIRHINDNVDVLIVQDCIDDIVLSNLVDVPTVRVQHGLNQVGIGSRVREIVSRSELTLANSKNTAREVEEMYGYTPDAIVTPGVDTREFSPDIAPAFHSEEIAVLFVGRVIEDKGVYELLAAFAEVPDGKALHIVGRGEIEKAERRARELGIEDSVHIHGKVPHSQLPPYYTACDFVCNPTFYESFGLVNIEAMACGTPVITTDIEGTKEYLQPGKTGLVVPRMESAPLAEQIERLATDEDLRQTIAKEGHKIAQSYSWEASASRLKNICSTVEGVPEAIRS